MFGRKKRPQNENTEPKTPAVDCDSAETDDSPKKLLILYVLDVLKKYSSPQHKLTQNEIISHINEDFGMECERKAVARNIRALIAYGYDIEQYEDNNEGYCLREKPFAEDDVFTVWEGLMSAKYIAPEVCRHVLDRLNDYCPTDYAVDGKTVGGGLYLTKIPPRDVLSANLPLLYRALKNNRRVRFMLRGRDRDNKPVDLWEETAEYSIYALLNIENDFYLAAAKSDSALMECFKVAELGDITVTDTENARIKTVNGYEKGFDKEFFAAQFITGFGGEISDFIVKIKNDKLNEAFEIFGSEARVLPDENGEDAETTTLDITANADRIFLWAFKAAEYVEVMQPAAMRFRLKEYFDLMCWKYR